MDTAKLTNILGAFVVSMHIGNKTQRQDPSSVVSSHSALINSARYLSPEIVSL
jgi:hypothetical protein